MYIYFGNEVRPGKFYENKNCLLNSIYMYFVSSRNVDVEYFQPIGNVHEEW